MIIVTGGAGFIGSNLVAALEATTDQKIVICDRLRDTEKWQNICKRKPLDIVHPDDLLVYLEDHGSEVEMIFHMGAISTTTEKDADLILDNNYYLSMMLYRWCSTNDVRLIYASSAATYGDGEQGFSDDYSDQHLKSFRPMNAYAWSKQWVDRKIVSLNDEGAKAPPQWVGLKFFNVYGPNEYHKAAQQSVVSHIFNRVHKGKEPARLFKSYNPKYPDGGQLRDFVWVGDVIDVLLWLKDNPNINGIYNVGTGKARSFLDLATSVYSALNLQPDIQYIDMPDGLAEKYQYFTEASMDNLRKAGYTKDFTSLEKGITKYVQGYLIKDDPYV